MFGVRKRLEDRINALQESADQHRSQTKDEFEAVRKKGRRLEQIASSRCVSRDSS